MTSYNTILGPDGKYVSYKSYYPENKKSNVIVVALHGIGSYMEYFDLLGESLTATGITVHSLQLRGFGNWIYEGKWDYHPENLITGDLNTLLKRIESDEENDRNVILLGDSWGCLLISRFLSENLISNIRGVVFASPFFLFGIKKIIYFILSIMVKFIPGARIKLFNDLSKQCKNEKFIEFDREIALGAKSLSIKLIYQVCKLAEEEKQKLLEKFSHPIFLALGGTDNFLKAVDLNKFSINLKSKQKTLKVYKDSGHFLLNDENCSEVFKDITQFIFKQIGYYSYSENKVRL